MARGPATLSSAAEGGDGPQLARAGCMLSHQPCSISPAIVTRCIAGRFVGAGTCKHGRDKVNIAASSTLPGSAFAPASPSGATNVWVQLWPKVLVMAQLTCAAAWPAAGPAPLVTPPATPQCMLRHQHGSSQCNRSHFARVLEHVDRETQRGLSCTSPCQPLSGIGQSGIYL